MRIPRPLLPLALAAVVACGSEVEPPSPSADVMRADSFRAVLADLAVARAATLPDTQAWVERRAGILEAHAVTNADLQAFVDAWGGHDEVMAYVYRGIGLGLDSLAKTRPAEGDAPGPAGAIPDTAPAADVLPDTLD